MMKKFMLLAVLCTLLGLTKTMAQEAYALLSNDSTTLKFYYDTRLHDGLLGKVYLIDNGTSYPSGLIKDGVNKKVKEITFDKGFADARPTSTKKWFYGMENLTSITGLENLNTSEVTDMDSMFMECRSLVSLDLSSFNTANVTTMRYMFRYCQSLVSIDLSSFNTAKVTDMNQMFSMEGWDSPLSVIYVGDGWSTASLTYPGSRSVFWYTFHLKGEQGTTYASNCSDASYARVDGGEEAPGYLSKKRFYDLWVCGTQVSNTNKEDVLRDGAFSYDAEKNVLMVKGNKTYEGNSLIENKIKGLTISAASDVTLNNKEYNAIKSETDLTITGPGKLSLLSTKDAALFIKERETATLTLKDANIDASGQWGISGPYGNSYNTKLDIINSTVVSKSTEDDGAVCDFRGGITLTGCQIAVPEGGRVDGARIVDANGMAAKEVTIEKVKETYNLWVGGIQVTGENQSDVLGDGKVAYDPMRQTLSLKGARITGRGTTADAGYGAAVYSKIKDLTIQVTGDNRLTGANKVALYLLGTKNTIISTKVLNPLPGQKTPALSCDGMLKLGASDRTARKDTLIVGGDVALAVKGDVVGNSYTGLSGGKPTYYSTLSIAGKASLKSGKVTEWAQLVMTKSHVIAIPEGGVFDATKHAVCDGKTIADAVEITLFTYNPADVNRDGAVDSADIVAVIKEMPDGDKKADVNGDGAIDSADIVAVIKAMK